MSEDGAVSTTTAVAVAKIDNGKAALYNPAAFDQIWRASKLFASSDLVPTAYKNKPENCFIAIEMADRMGISPFAMLQSLVIIQGKPSMEAKLIIALVNDSGIFADPLEYEIVGNDPYAQDYKVRAFAKMRKTGKLCEGPWITYQMVKGEGWLDKVGSKWKTMPSIMFMYRAASFFAKVYCPNITMGMQTREEVEDSTMINITPGQQAKPDPPALVAPTLVAPAPVSAAVPSAAADPPPLVAPHAEIIDVEIGEITEPPPVETPEQRQTRTRRTKAQIESDKLAESEKIAALPVMDDDDFPDPPGGIPAEPEPTPIPDEPTASEPMGDLF